jgi:ABC-type polysaccharide/polyol phosphate transport system ATPase subunit
MTACFTDKKEGIAPSYSVMLNNVGKRYCVKKNTTTQETFWALKDVSFTVRAGTILGVIGRNGAGKTTLLNMIAGILQPTEGAVSINAAAVRGLFNLGVGFQDELSGRENIFLNGALLGASRKEIEVSMPSIIEFSELGKFIDMPLGSYSQGMRLRLGFSVVANLDFDLLVIDEVLAVGDALFQSKCYERIMDFKRKGKTLIITSQDISMIERLCDEVMLIDHGCKLFSGRPKEAVDRYRMLLNTEKFFVGALPNVSAGMIEDTKKWADNISDWGKHFGSKEAVIEDVTCFNGWGNISEKIKTGCSLKIKARFNVKNGIEKPHFGIAIFRKDGVYCHGPNTNFDRLRIPELKKGRGSFILYYPKILLAPGEYKMSAAIWDESENIPFDHHYGCYRLTITGFDNFRNQLLNVPFKNSRILQATDTDIVMKDKAGVKKDVFVTDEFVRLILSPVFGKNFSGSHFRIQVGIYREDGILCQNFFIPISKRFFQCLTFPNMSLLPGRYFISVGIWDTFNGKFELYSDRALYFRMISDRHDHGTVYMKHKWTIKGV